MEVEVYRAAHEKDIPEGLFWALDGVDDRYIAAFYHSPDSVQLVVVAWGRVTKLTVRRSPLVAITTSSSATLRQAVIVF